MFFIGMVFLFLSSLYNNWENVSLRFIANKFMLIPELPNKVFLFMFFTVRLELVHGELILDFLMKTSTEIVCDRCATLGLKILRRCLAGGTDKLAISKLLYINAIPTLLDLLKSTNEELQESSLRLLGLLR